MFHSNYKALCRAFYEIFNDEKYCYIEIPVKGQSRSMKLVPFYRWLMLSIVFYSNIVHKFFVIFSLQLYSDLENQVKGHSRSSELTRIDTAHKISY